jgi:hypothetical protein
MSSSTGALFLASRGAGVTDTWSAFEDLKLYNGDIGAFGAVDCAGTGSTLQVVGLVDGRAAQVRRSDSRGWQAFWGDLSSEVSLADRLSDIDVTGMNGLLQVKFRASSDVEFFASELPGHWWTAAVNITPQVAAPGSMASGTVTASGGVIHSTIATADGGIFHTVRWQGAPTFIGYGDVRAATGSGEHFRWTLLEDGH